MRKVTSRLGIATLAIVATLVGVWLGEDLNTPFRNIVLFGVAALCSGLLAVLLCYPSRRKGIAAAVGVAALIASGFWLGDQIATRAFNSCVNHGDEVRSALEVFKLRSGHYPDSLAELGQALPGDRWLRRNILFYRRQGAGYVLSFTDWLVEHTATDSTGWDVRK